MQLKEYIKQNAPWIYEYINTEVLKGIGAINANFFIYLIKDIYVKQADTQSVDVNVLPYYLFTKISGKGKMDYTVFRKESISLVPLTNEASVYHNYVRFSLKDDTFYIDLMQTKMGGMPLDEDIVKFSKSIAIKPKGLETFIEVKKNNALNDTLKTIQDEVERIL